MFFSLGCYFIDKYLMFFFFIIYLCIECVYQILKLLIFFLQIKWSVLRCDVLPLPLHCSKVDCSSETNYWCIKCKDDEFLYKLVNRQCKGNHSHYSIPGNSKQEMREKKIKQNNLYMLFIMFIKSY